MNFPLPTDTAHVRIESRQYNLLGIDLGEGVDRSALVLGAVLFVPWLFLCWKLGVPLLNGGLVLWITPPLLITARGHTRDESGRPRIHSWGDSIGGLLRGNRPIVNGDTAPSRSPKAFRTDLAFLVVDPKDPSA